MSERQSDVILERLMALHPKIIDLSLDRMTDILQKLGHPEKNLPPVIHVAGTNGKGSLLAFIRSILEAAGKTVHVYTSPHLVRFAERIVLAGEVISEAKLSDLLTYCKTVNGTETITYFEITTAAALKAFADTPADYLLLETGLGGRLDATNVVDKPALTALTPISHDHEQYLGSDLAGIAFEKAGILKKDVPAVLGPQSKVVIKALLEQATKIGAPTFQHGKDWHFSITSRDHWEYEDEEGKHTYVHPALLGDHQIANAATAIACLKTLPGFTLEKEHIDQGLQNVIWPARLQRLVKGPLAQRLPEGVELWLDGGHNEAAGAQIAASFQSFDEVDPKPTYLICGMLNTKDQVSFFRKLEPITDKGITISIEGEAATTSAAELAAMGCAAGIDCIPAPNVEDAVDMLIPHLSKRPCRLLIAGSLYLAGGVLRRNS
ncbi:MAG: bifunctional folylpolyglutamate synthase/dihydrofolate synthase [Sneathiella sp.]|nr:bifunctional folylpolyglutamate synthase/dihydrofolate synthase [Sneathiella sp.]